MRLINKQLLLVVFTGIITTITLQTYIGKPNLYTFRQNYFKDSTLNMHSAILTNRPPQGTTWLSLQANGTNMRFGVVFLAEFLHRISHKSLLSIYYWLDNAALILNFVLLFLFLNLFITADWALAGAVFFYSLQVTTYMNHYFHPWDRISLSFWLVMLSIIYNYKTKIPAWIPLNVFLLGMCVKYDLIVISLVATAFFFLGKAPLRKFWIAPAMFLLGVGFFLLMNYLRSGGIPLSQSGLSLFKELIKGNLGFIRAYGFSYPPFLVFSLPIVFGVFGWRVTNLFGKVCFVTGILGLIGYFFASWFHETRAEMPYLLLIFPCALQGMKSIFSNSDVLEQSKSKA